MRTQRRSLGAGIVIGAAGILGGVAKERRKSLEVEVPSAKDDSIRFGRVGIIVSIGFVIGVVWPRLAGVRLAPNVPGGSDSAAAEGDRAGAEAESSAPPASAAPPPAASESAAPAPALPDNGASIQGEPQIVSCRDKSKRRVAQCDHLEYDRVARSHVLALGSCDGAEHVEGVLSLRLDLDFESATVRSFGNGRSTTLSPQDADNLIGCAKREFAGVSFSDVQHENESYTIFYRVEFHRQTKRAAAAAEAAAASLVEASGRATVSWDVALVHASAGRDGEVVARILQGTRVVVTGRQGDWYRVKYDARGNQGWVFRTAIGM